MRSEILLLLASLLACLLVAEGVFRFLGFGRSLAYHPDPDLLWVLRPSQEAYTPTYEVAYDINAHGLRDDELSEAKPAGELRVLLLGDSVVFGQGVPRSATLAQQLEARLAENDRWDAAQVINAGIPGYGPQQERVFLERRGLDFEPDVVVLGFCHNDLINGQRWEALQRKARETGTALGDPWRSRSALYHVASGFLRRFQARDDDHILAYLPPEVDETSWAYTLAELRAAARVLERKRVPFVAAVFPVESEVTEGERRELGPLWALAEEEAIHLLDLYPAFAAHRDEELFLDPVHLTARGYEVAAEALHGFLRSRDLLPPASP